MMFHLLCTSDQTPLWVSPLLELSMFFQTMQNKRILYVDVNYLLICEECLIMCSLQDEVAHTVTESRVLQNTRHPFLTVRTLITTTTLSANIAGILFRLVVVHSPMLPAHWLIVL